MTLGAALQIAGAVALGSGGCWAVEQFGDALHPIVAKGLQIGTATLAVLFIGRVLGVH